jgi:uncharacterized protein
MILVDANILLYAKISTFTQHEKSKDWLDALLSSETKVGIPWESIIAFIRISTNARIFSKPLAIDSAWQQIEEWLSCPFTWTPIPEENHQQILRPLIPFCNGNSGLIHDAQLAALALSHGLTIYSADNDFSRFTQVRWVNPLA